MEFVHENENVSTSLCSGIHVTIKKGQTGLVGRGSTEEAFSKNLQDITLEKSAPYLPYDVRS